MFAATRVPQDLLPDITLPVFILVTPDPGASPDVVDRDVSVPVTNAVQSLSGVDTITSSSSQGASLVVVLMKDGTDARAARQDIMQAVDGILASLPQTAQSTTIQSFSTNTMAIIIPPRVRMFSATAAASSQATPGISTLRHRGLVH